MAYSVPAAHLRDLLLFVVEIAIVGKIVSSASLICSNIQ